MKQKYGVKEGQELDANMADLEDCHDKTLPEDESERLSEKYDTPQNAEL